MVAVTVCLAVLALRGTLPEVSGTHCCHAGIAEATEQKVFFNTKSLIYHHDGCIAASRCTANCIWISLIPVAQFRHEEP